MGPHSILIEHNPIGECVFFAYELGKVFKEAGWYLYLQPYGSTKLYNNLYFETGQNASDLVMRLVFSMANMGLVAAARHDRPSDADVLLFVGPRRPPVPVLR